VPLRVGRFGEGVGRPRDRAGGDGEGDEQCGVAGWSHERVCHRHPGFAAAGGARPAGALGGVRFQNVSIAAPSVLGEPQLLWGRSDARIRDLVFENLTLGGQAVSDAGFFQVNEHVERLRFFPADGANP